MILDPQGNRVWLKPRGSGGSPGNVTRRQAAQMAVGEELTGGASP